MSATYIKDQINIVNYLHNIIYLHMSFQILNNSFGNGKNRYSSKNNVNNLNKLNNSNNNFNTNNTGIPTEASSKFIDLIAKKDNIINKTNKSPISPSKILNTPQKINNNSNKTSSFNSTTTIHTNKTNNTNTNNNNNNTIHTPSKSKHIIHVLQKTNKNFSPKNTTQKAKLTQILDDFCVNRRVIISETNSNNFNVERGKANQNNSQSNFPSGIGNINCYFYRSKCN